MTTIYTQLGYAGPWCCDDDLIVCDGWVYRGGPVIDGIAPTVDGLAVGQNFGGAVKRRGRSQGLTRARRNDTPMRGRDRR